VKEEVVLQPLGGGDGGEERCREERCFLLACAIILGGTGLVHQRSYTLETRRL
jgi:hypothetical protein